jgi:hypothetical protein
MTEYWTIDEILHEADKTHNVEVNWHGKTYRVAYKVPRDIAELPRVKALPRPGAKATDDERNEYEAKALQYMVLDMVMLADPAITKEAWDKFPLTVRTLIMQAVKINEEGKNAAFFDQ